MAMALYRCEDTWIPRAIVTCDCCSECTELHLQVDDEEPRAVYVTGQPREPTGLLRRIGYAWRVLRRGHLWPDAMVLDADTAQDLADWLREQRQEKRGVPIVADGEWRETVLTD